MSEPTVFLDGRVSVHAGDCLTVIKTLPDNSIDAVVTDPPYALVSVIQRFGNSPRSEATENMGNPYGRTGRGFMGQKWDTGEVAFSVEFWSEVLRVLKPGGHVAAFGGTRTYHRLACAIEDAGFEVRDMIAWTYGQGFPKSHDVSKGIDKAAGAARLPTGEVRRASIQRNGIGADWDAGAFASHPEETKKVTITAPATDEARAWEGWGTALKPAIEPVCLARKPLSEGTVAANVLRWGTGALNIDGCRVSFENDAPNPATNPLYRKQNGYANGNAPDEGSTSFRLKDGSGERPASALGRWPANLVHDGSPEVLAAFPESDGQRAEVGPQYGVKSSVNVFGDYGARETFAPRGDTGSAARFFYTSKADGDDRLGSKHPTVKPVDLMQWLCRLICPPGGTILDPFSGTGTTGEAAWREGFNAVLIEREQEYLTDIARRMSLCGASPRERKHESIKARGKAESAGPLFDGFDHVAPNVLCPLLQAHPPDPVPGHGVDMREALAFGGSPLEMAALRREAAPEEGARRSGDAT